jgi:hypothetical protein
MQFKFPYYTLRDLDLNMKLWILKPIDEKKMMEQKGLIIKRWTWDCAWGFVVRAKDEQDARRKAADDAGDEGCDAWLDAKLTSCMNLTNNGESGIIIRDFL